MQVAFPQSCMATWGGHSVSPLNYPKISS